MTDPRGTPLIALKGREKVSCTSTSSSTGYTIIEFECIATDLRKILLVSI